MDLLREEVLEESRRELEDIIRNAPAAPAVPTVGGECITLDEAELIGIYRTMQSEQREEWRLFGLRLVNPHAANAPKIVSIRIQDDKRPRNRGKGK